MIRIVTDSAADFPAALAQEYDVRVVPLTVNIGGIAYRDGVDLGSEEFYRLLPQPQSSPSTAQPAPADFEAVFREIVAAGDEAVAVMVSSGLSGTFNSAHLAAGLLGPSAPITVVDTRSVSLGETLMVVAAARAARAGRSRAEIAEMVGRMSEETLVFLTLETLEYLKRGGRIGGATAFLGSVLRIQPIIVIKEGRVEAADRTRSRRRAIERIVEAERDRFGRRPVWASVAHAVCPGDSALLAAELQAALNVEYFLEVEVGPVCGTHTGPGTLAAAVVPAPDI